jgi:hypothetical protein
MNPTELDDRTGPRTLRFLIALGFLVVSLTWIMFVLRPLFSSGESGLYETNGTGFRSTGNIKVDMAAYVISIIAVLAGLFLAPLALVGRRDKALSIILVAEVILLGGYLLFMSGAF